MLYKKIILFLKITIIFFILSNQQILSKQMLFNEKDDYNDSLNSTSNMHLLFKGYSYLTLNFCKHSSSNVFNFSDRFKNDGNNFYGISIEPSIRIYKLMSLSFPVNIEFGNLNGNSAFFIYCIPSFIIGNNIVSCFAGVGPSLLYTKNNFIDNGGYGISSDLGLRFKIITNYMLQFKIGVDFFRYKTYNSIGFGFVYLNQ